MTEENTQKRGVATDSAPAAGSVNTCRYCKNFMSYQEAYDFDDLEPFDEGFCDLEGFNCKYVTWESKACSDFTPNRGISG